MYLAATTIAISDEIEAIIDRFDTPQLWTWSVLKGMECLIVEQPPERADD